MSIKKQNITGKSPKEVADMLQVYGDVISVPFQNISDIIWALNRENETKVIIIIKGNNAIIGTEQI